MAGTLQLANFVTLGQQLYVLMNPQNADVVVEEIGKFRRSEPSKVGAIKGGRNRLQVGRRLGIAPSGIYFLSRVTNVRKFGHSRWKLCWRTAA